MTLLASLLLAVLLIFALPLAVEAAPESICPGGSGPRGDVVRCLDFESLGNCSTGQESACWNDNWPSNGEQPSHSDAYSWFIKQDGGAAVGSGYITTRVREGVSGADNGLIFQGANGLGTTFPRGNFAIRYYQKHSEGFIAGYSGHNTQMQAQGSNGCDSAIKFQLSTWSGASYYPIGGTPGPCGPDGGSFFINPTTTGQSLLRNDRWNRIEFEVILDTSCTDATQPFGCNGKYRVWLNGTKVTERTDVNWGGFRSNMQFSTLWFPEHYYHYTAPAWGYRTALDNLVVSDCTGGACDTGNAPIGAAAGENLGTGQVASSPYGASAVHYATWLGRRAGSDCSPYNGAVDGYDNVYVYRTAGTLVSSPAHNLYVTQPDCSAATNGSGQFAASSGGGSGMAAGVWNTSQYIFPQWVSYHWLYVPSSNNLSTTRLGLSGISRNDGSNYVAVSLTSDSKWAVSQRTGGSYQQMTTSTSAAADTWHEVELIVWSDNKVSLMVGDGVTRVRLFDKSALPLNTDWLWVANDGFTDHVLGVIDFVGTGTFTVNIDDANISTLSAWSCDGWGTDCLFGEGGTPPSQPRFIWIVLILGLSFVIANYARVLN